MFSYYVEQSFYTNPGKWEEQYKLLPDSIEELVKVVQSIIIHQFWIIDSSNYEFGPKDLFKQDRVPNDEVNLLTVEEILDKYYRLDSTSFMEPRIPEKHVVGNCRDFTLLLVSFLRYKGIPARSRSGVATYFIEGHYEDHFVCEYYDKSVKRWILVDAQLDALMIKKCNLKFNIFDVPHSEFLNSVESIRLARENNNPEAFGIHDFFGMKYLQYKLFSDLAHMNKEEILPWEGWGVGDRAAGEKMIDGDYEILDEIELLIYEDQISKFKPFYETQDALKRPSDYKPFHLKFPFFIEDKN